MEETLGEKILVWILSAFVALILVWSVTFVVSVVGEATKAPAPAVKTYFPPATNDGTGEPQHGRDAVIAFEFLMEIARKDGATINGKDFTVSRAPRTELSEFDLHQCYAVQDNIASSHGIGAAIFDGLAFYCGGGK